MKNFECMRIKRYNIYSCCVVKINGLEICFDPAKIREEDMKEISPDYIFISHESMDHMDPSQVYILQKKKNCKIFCSIAAGIDLLQYFPSDIDFRKSVNPLIPESEVLSGNLFIQTGKSIHCDYMMPLVFKLTFIEEKVSLLHCFDSLISDEIVKLSQNVSVAIIPIGIAKGVSLDTGYEYLEKLHSKMFITNHFKSTKELIEFMSPQKDNVVYLNWNDAIDILVESIPIEIKNRVVCDISSLFSLDKRNLLNILQNFNSISHQLFFNHNFLNNIFSVYSTSEEDEKIILLLIYILIAVTDPNLINDKIITYIQTDLQLPPHYVNNNLHTVILFFLGVYAQKSSQIMLFDEVFALLKYDNEHISYWVTEYLGRSMASSPKANSIIIDKLLYIINDYQLYNSVVVRRKIFWELYRIIKYIPTCARKFVKYIEDGLTDSNPDVKLLALLCIVIANNILELTETQMGKIFDLLEDPEDDVRETCIRIIRDLNKRNVILANIDRLYTLSRDINYHVRYQADVTNKAVKSWLDLK